jgi:hypothetical protein
MNYPYVDLLAWACVPIEAKAVIKTGNRFNWTFRPGQLAKLTGLLMFIAICEPTNRIFIIPVEVLRVARKTRAPRVGGFCLSLDSEHRNSHWHKFQKYEGRIDLIEVARIQWQSNLLSTEAA